MGVRKRGTLSTRVQLLSSHPVFELRLPLSRLRPRSLGLSSVQIAFASRGVLAFFLGYLAPLVRLSRCALQFHAFRRSHRQHRGCFLGLGHYRYHLHIFLSLELAGLSEGSVEPDDSEAPSPFFVISAWIAIQRDDGHVCGCDFSL